MLARRTTTLPLLGALFLHEFRWWQWKGMLKFLLWLTVVLGFIGLGLVRLDESGRTLALHEEVWE
jgi:hypothetical protein